MDVRESYSSEYVKKFDTEKLRDVFLCEGLFRGNSISMVYSHVDRVIVGGVVPCSQEIKLDSVASVGTDYFLERREMGVINLGDDGLVVVDGSEYKVKNRQALYIPKETKSVSFMSISADIPARFYLNSVPAHKVLKTRLVTEEEANSISLGSQKNVNKRTLNQYLHPDIVETCQLTMGITDVAEGNAWNTFPPHTHDRRMEVYLYFNIPEDQMVFHFMGEGSQTRHIVVRNEEAVLSPSWSIHAGVGTQAYSFVWSMAGENQTFDDMDYIPLSQIK